MRSTLGAAVGLLVVAGMLVTGHRLDARAVGGLNTVTVSPAHGKVAVPFQVTYAISPCQGAAGLTIGFSWGALAPAGQLLRTAATDSACRATLSTAPPAKPAPGTYQVFGFVALPTGSPAPNTDASTSYTVEVTPTPTPTASSSATAKATTHPSASTSAPGSIGASPSASAPYASDQPATAATPQSSAGKLTLVHPGAQQLWWTLGWPAGRRALVLALSLLAGLAFLCAGIFRRRRTRAAAALSKDKSAKDKAA